MRNIICDSLIQLGYLFNDLGKGIDYKLSYKVCSEQEYLSFNEIIINHHRNNPWFTESNIRKSLTALSLMCAEKELLAFSKKIEFTDKPYKIAIIMAGNIPLVGFHDFLCVLLSGNKSLIKLSSDDNLLFPAFIDFFISINPNAKSLIEFITPPLKNIDAVIATGGNNASVYFEKYFGDLPHIFRKNRTSLAIITGDETKEELTKLGADVFDYFGRGCRSVSHLIIHHSFNLNVFFESILPYGDIINHNKYGNNYDYNRAIFLMNQLPFLDNNFVLLNESSELFSPLSMINYHRYNHFDEIKEYIDKNQENIQVIVGKNDSFIPFGESQSPSLNDFADNINTLEWLEDLNKK